MWITKITCCNGTFWRRECQPTPVFLPGEFHGQRILAGYGPWGSQRVGHDWAHTHTHTHTLLLLLYVSLPNTKDKAMLLLVDKNNSLLTNSSFFHDLITTKVENRVYSGSSGSISSVQLLSNVRFRQYIVKLLITRSEDTYAIMYFQQLIYFFTFYFLLFIYFDFGCAGSCLQHVDLYLARHRASRHVGS